MSADNGVYILQTAGPEFRVTYAQGMDSIYGKFDDTTGHWRGDMAQMRHFFGNAKVFTDFGEALDYAESMSYDYDYLEYGVCLLTDFRELKFTKEK